MKRKVWMGVPTDDFGGTVAFFRDVMGLKEEIREGDFAILRLPGGEAVEVFGPSLRDQEQFATGPVVGFLVEDVPRAREDMEAEGGRVRRPGAAWPHFRGRTGKSTRSLRSWRKRQACGRSMSPTMRMEDFHERVL